MKTISALIALLAFAIAPFAMAEEATEVTYVAKMSGVTWGGCKRDVRAAFTSIEGVSNVEIAGHEEAGFQAVTVTGPAGITQEAAIESLGKKAKRYVVVEWDSGDEDAS